MSVVLDIINVSNVNNCDLKNSVKLKLLKPAESLDQPQSSSGKILQTSGRHWEGAALMLYYLIFPHLWFDDRCREQHVAAKPHTAAPLAGDSPHHPSPPP